VTASHLSLQIIDFQYFINTYLNQILVWTLDVKKAASEHKLYAFLTDMNLKRKSIQYA